MNENKMEIETADEEVMVCTECGQPMQHLTKEHVKWYKDHNFELPKRCPVCLKKKKSVVYSSSNEGIGSNAFKDAFAAVNFKDGSLPDVAPAITPKKQKAVKKSPLVIKDTWTTVEAPHPYTDAKANHKDLEMVVSEDARKAKVVNEEHKLTFICTDCGEPFTIDSSEVAWYKSKGFELPKRCSDCRKRKHAVNEERAINAVQQPGDDVVHVHNCTDCGQTFEMTVKHEKWFTSKGLFIPHRCPQCAKIHREQKNSH